MDFIELEQLFYKGELEQLIIEGENYLKQNPEDTEVLFLMATAYHDQVFYDGHEAIYDSVKQYTIPYLRRILEIDPNHQKTLFEILSYPITNQYNLWSIARPKLHITEENKQEFIGYAERLKQQEGFEIYGYNFIINIYEGLEDIEHQLLNLEKAIIFNEDHNSSERETRDKNTSIFFMKKIDLLEQYKGFDKKDLVTLIEKQLPKFVSQHESQYIQLAEIAYEQGAIDLAVKTLVQLLDANHNSIYVIEEFCKWHKILTNLLNQGYKSADAKYFLLMIERNYYETLEVAADTYYHHALELTKSDHEQYFPHHFAGTYLFENGEYSKAYPYLEKAIQLNPIAITYRRYVECAMHLNYELPTSLPKLNSHPLELYGRGTEIDDLIQEIAQSESNPALIKIREQFYIQAHEAFEAYFNEDQYFSLYNCDLHQFAMNCNNLAIAHIATASFTRAAKIAELGLTYSNFWEIHSTLIEALIKDENFEEAKHALNCYFSYYNTEDIPCIKHLIFEGNRITVDYHLNLDEDIYNSAEKQLEQIYDYAEAHPELEEYDLRDLEAAKSSIQTVIYNILEQESDIFKKEIYEKKALKYSSESNPQYMLMQIYHDLEMYAACNKAAQQYLKNKPEFLLNDFDQAKSIHLIMKSHLMCEEYEEASNIFNDYNQMMQEVLSGSDLITWLLRAIKVKSKVEQHNDVIQIGNQIKTIYNEENWDYDNDLETTTLTLAETYYNQGNLKTAHQLLDVVLAYSDADPQAHILKKKWKKPSFLSKIGF